MVLISLYWQFGGKFHLVRLSCHENFEEESPDITVKVMFLSTCHCPSIKMFETKSVQLLI